MQPGVDAWSAALSGQEPAGKLVVVTVDVTSTRDADAVLASFKSAKQAKATGGLPAWVCMGTRVACAAWEPPAVGRHTAAVTGMTGVQLLGEHVYKTMQKMVMKEVPRFLEDYTEASFTVRACMIMISAH